MKKYEKSSEGPHAQPQPMGTVAALENLYQVFSIHPKPRVIPVCACCVSEQEVKVLLNTPLRRLTCRDLTCYASSVYLTSGSLPDFKYLLPRLLEIFVLKAEAWPDPEVMLSKLALAEWQQWSSSERQAVTVFLEAVFAQAIQDESDSAIGVDAVVCGVARTGIDMAPFLRRLEEPSARDSLHSFHEWNARSLNKKGRLSNAFWDDDAIAAPVIAWLQSPETQRLLWSPEGTE